MTQQCTCVTWLLHGAGLSILCLGRRWEESPTHSATGVSGSPRQCHRCQSLNINSHSRMARFYIERKT